MVNYGIRYPFSSKYNCENNYGAWIPKIEIDIFLNIDKNEWKDKGLHNHEFIPKDYVPKVK